MPSTRWSGLRIAGCRDVVYGGLRKSDRSTCASTVLLRPSRRAYSLRLQFKDPPQIHSGWLLSWTVLVLVSCTLERLARNRSSGRHLFGFQPAFSYTLWPPASNTADARRDSAHVQAHDGVVMMLDWSAPRGMTSCTKHRASPSCRWRSMTSPHLIKGSLALTVRASQVFCQQHYPFCRRRLPVAC